MKWYKREPRAFLDGVRAARLSARDVAVYAVILDLIYEGDGETPDDPAYFAAHFSDLGSAAVRRSIDRLVEAGKVEREGSMLVNRRAKNEAKTAREQSENRAFSGRLGGVSSGFSRRRSKENKDLAEANASYARAREERESIGSGGKPPPPMRAQARSEAACAAGGGGGDPPVEILPDDPVLARATALRDRVVEAAGADVTRCRSPARWLGSEARDLIAMWIRETGLSDDQILETVKETADAKSDGPAESLRYFSRAIQRRAERQRQGLPAEPSAGGRSSVGSIDVEIGNAAQRLYRSLGGS